jgi:hypothetical protein
VPKQPIKLSPRHAGRRVRWTFEVSADVDAEKHRRVKKPAKVRQRVRSKATEAAVPATAPAVDERPAVASVSNSVTVPVARATAPWQSRRGQMVTLAGVAVLVIATIAIPGQPPASDAAREQQPPEPRESSAEVAPDPSSPATAPVPRTVTAATRYVAKPRALTELPVKPSVQKVTARSWQPAKPASPPASTATDNLFGGSESPAKPAAPEAVAIAPTTASAASPSSAVTVTGCLEISTDGNEFRLADTEGADAPKARSWRTGFMKKRTAPVALIGIADPLALKNSIGRRVAATGVLTSRELQVSSVRVVRSYCN